MKTGKADFVYRSEAGRMAVEAHYEGILSRLMPAGGERIRVQTPFGETHVLAFGEPGNPAVVMLHGTISNSATWLGCVADFARHFRVYCADIPGEPGLSEPRRISPAGDGPVRWLDALLAGLREEKAAFVGMSLGGFYALSFAAAYPERAAALSLFVPSGLAPQRADFIPKALLCMLLGKPGRRLMNRIVYRGAVVTREALEFQDLACRHFVPLTEPIPVLTDDELARLSMPVQYFAGEFDALLDTGASAERLRGRVPASEVNVLPETGHVIVDRFGEALAFCERALAGRNS